LAELPPLRPNERRAIEAKLQEALPVIDECAITPERVPQIAAVVRALVGLHFQIYLRCAARSDLSAIESLRHCSRGLEAAFSIDGFGYGAPEGWFVRAWMDSNTRVAVEATWDNPEHSLWVTAIGAAVGAMLQSKGDAGAGARSQYIRAGLDLIARTRRHAADSAWSAGLEECARGISASPNTPGTAAIVQAALGPDEEVAPLFRTALRLLPLILNQLHGRPLDGFGSDSDRDRKLRSDYERRRARGAEPFAPLRVGGSSLVCGACMITPGSAVSSRASFTDEIFVCDHCGSLLVPYDFRSPAVLDVLAHFLPTTAEISQ
jgi:hypothetical protein